MEAEIKIDPEFKALCRPLTKDELGHLTANILKDGCREPLVVWETGEESILIDGHNRHSICTKHGKEFQTSKRQFADRTEAKLWIINNQMGRRNLSVIDMVALVRMKKEALAELARNRKACGQGGVLLPQKSAEANGQGEVRHQMAEEANISHFAFEQIATVLDNGAPELIEAVREKVASANSAAEIATKPVEVQREIVAKGKKEILAVAKLIRAEKADKKRQDRVEKIATIAKGNTALDGKCGLAAVLYSDPPWRYDDNSTDPSRVIENQYPTMSHSELCAMGDSVKGICTDDAILYLWVPPPLLKQGIAVMEAWGFEYKTGEVWDKTKIGMGYYCRQQHEHVLIGVRGNLPKPHPSTLEPSVYSEPRGEHSAKPVHYYDRLDRQYPDLPKRELFARCPARPGWLPSWGNQAE